MVVGAGLLGLATAAELGRRGRDVVCLERAEVGHERSGSKGSARIFRLGYTDPLYVSMGRRALAQWRRMEAEVGRELLVTGGFLTFGDALGEVRAAMEAAGAPPIPMSESDVAERFPGLRVSGDALFEPEAGVIVADRVLASLRALVPDLRQSTAVTSLEDGDRGVSIRTGGGVLECATVVLCTGAWSGRTGTMAGLPAAGALTASWQTVAYFRPRPETGEIPAFVERGDRTAYGLPDPLGAGDAPGPYKLGIHEPGPPVDPDGPAATPSDEDLAWLAATASRVLPGVDPVPIASEQCCYDNTPDTDFVLDRVGRIVIGGGTSGHGFKFGPLLGSALADLVEGRDPTLPMERFTLRRASLAGGPLL